LAFNHRMIGDSEASVGYPTLRTSVLARQQRT